ncbi:hypothetical protein BO71DRAFT_395126 [Aspergillus ellipticus CBS 707.79]|uniref:Protein kinase domain-containing protein n=1 Tax=Aspergillus ellipticus CBS 707.79 TaxID=1448320 RepID=A0A319DMB1_9EURO|nr:hypothetical protein BO71DRAFT_395126 [Aspergillus ellipticus CBS 707.79]
MNNRLERLLLRHEAFLLSEGLMAEILSSTLELPDVKEDSFGSHHYKVGKVIRLHQRNEALQRNEMDLVQSVDSREPCGSNVLTTFDVDQPFIAGRGVDSVISISSLRGFKEPVLPYNGEVPCCGMGLEVPDVRSVFYYTPEAGLPGEYVLVEWRSQTTECQHSRIPDEGRTECRQRLVSLLHETSVADADFRILNCMGYILANGRLLNSIEHPAVGFVYQFPTKTAGSAIPITLREISDTALQSPEPDVPDLDDRSLLAQRLSLALYQLHCAGLLHHKISSHSIFYFHDPESGAYDISKPYIGGWRYTPPDHHFQARQLEHSQDNHEVTETVYSNSLGDTAIYVHPDRLTTTAPRFRKSYDVYSLGVVLIEIAMWKPARSWRILFVTMKWTCLKSTNLDGGQPH